MPATPEMGAALGHNVVEIVALHNTFHLALFPSGYVMSRRMAQVVQDPSAGLTGKGGNDGYDPSAERSDGASVIRVHRCNRARDGLVDLKGHGRRAKLHFGEVELPPVGLRRRIGATRLRLLFWVILIALPDQRLIA